MSLAALGGTQVAAAYRLEHQGEECIHPLRCLNFKLT